MSDIIDPFRWKRHGVEWRLYRDRRVVGSVVPDAKWPGMWRTKLPGGLSDMADLARARDAALDWSATPRCRKVLQQNQRRFSAPASPVRLDRRGLPSPPPVPLMTAHNSPSRSLVLADAGALPATLGPELEEAAGYARAEKSEATRRAYRGRDAKLVDWGWMN